MTRSDRGRMHYEGGILHAEGDFDEAALADLERRGYQLLRWKDVNLFFGGVHAAYRDPSTGELSGAGDPAGTARRRSSFRRLVIPTARDWLKTRQ